MLLLRLLKSVLLGVSTPACAAQLTLSIVPRWSHESLTIPAAPQVNSAGQELRVTRLAALLSGATLLRPDGSGVRLEGQYGFIDAETGRLDWTLRNVPAGDYVGLEFQIGVPPEVNHRNPGSWAPAHALNPLMNRLHWGWQGGYVFLALEGRWRDGKSAAAETERGFSYHLATDARLMSVSFAANYRVGAATKIELALDLSRVLDGKLAADDGSESTHSAEKDSLAIKVAGAIEHAWFWIGASENPEAGAKIIEASTPKAAIGTPVAFMIPAGFPQPMLPADNPLTAEGIALGELLFSDPRLSSNGTQSCASCHAPEHAFSDHVAFSVGAEGKAGARNAMPLMNLAWSSSFAWDGSQPRIRDQARAAWTNPIEMNATPEKIVASLQSDAALAAGFRAAFGTTEISAERITLALEQFLLTQVSADAKFDRARHGAAMLTDEEKRGFELFATEYDPARGKRGADCFHCHGGMLFTDYAMKNNGLDALASDLGRAKVTGDTADRGKFKTPSLRNVALTAPYMHDGRFATLEDVVAHYDHGVQRSATLDPNLAKHPSKGLTLSSEDQRALVAFLKTLTDGRFTSATQTIARVDEPWR